MWTEMSDPAILELIGKRIKDIRLKRNMQQEELASFSGVGLSSIANIEKGKAVSLGIFLKVLRGLDMLENLEQLVPIPPISPKLIKKLKGKVRLRARRSK